MARHTWTRAEALEAGQTFVTTQHRLPTQTDTLLPDLPYWQTLALLFGSLAAYCALLPVPIPVRLRPRQCLRCSKRFQPKHKDLHLCDLCKRDPHFADTADWLGHPTRVANSERGYR